MRAAAIVILNPIENVRPFVRRQQISAWQAKGLLLCSCRCMTRLRAISSPSLCLVALAGAMLAQQQPAWEIESLSTNEGGVVYDLATGWAVAKLGHVFRGSFKALLVDGSGTGYLRTACDYVHLNPVPAKLLGPQDLLLSAEAPGLDGPRSPSASQESAGQAGDCCPPAEGHDASGQEQRWAVAFGRSEQRHG